MKELRYKSISSHVAIFLVQFCLSSFVAYSSLHVSFAMTWSVFPSCCLQAGVRDKNTLTLHLHRVEKNAQISVHLGVAEDFFASLDQKQAMSLRSVVKRDIFLNQ